MNMCLEWHIGNSRQCGNCEVRIGWEGPGAASPHPEAGVWGLGGRWSEGAQTQALSKGT